MNRKLTTLAAIAALEAFGLSPAMVAAENSPPAQQPEGMTGDTGGMDVMPQMTGDQVKQMVENCNRMMPSTEGGAMDIQHPAAPSK